jgi:Na+/H+-translocating membrane pyrophosphatase
MNFALQMLTGSGPTIVLCILGIVFALVQKEKAPKAAIFVVLSLVVLLGLVIVRPIVYNLLGRIDSDGKAMMFQAWGFFCTLVDVASTAGLIFAAFCDRQAPAPYANPYAKEVTSFPPRPTSFPSPAPLPPLGGPMRPPQ